MNRQTQIHIDKAQKYIVPERDEQTDRQTGADLKKKEQNNNNGDRYIYETLLFIFRIDSL